VDALSQAGMCRSIPRAPAEHKRTCPACHHGSLPGLTLPSLRVVGPCPVRAAAGRPAQGVPLGEPTDFLLIPDVVNLMDTAQLERLIDAIYAKGVWPVLIVLDTVAWSMGGAEENSNSEATLLTMAMRVLRQRYGATVLGVHHEGSDVRRGARGATAFEANVDVVMETVLDKGVSQSELEVGMPVWLRNRKQKSQAKFTTFRLAMKRVVGEFEGAVFDALVPTQVVGAESEPPRGDRPSKPSKAEYKESGVLAWTKLNDLCLLDTRGATYREWMLAACKNGRMTESTFNVARSALRFDGWVERDGAGKNSRYRTVQRGGSGGWGALDPYRDEDDDGDA
jgi:hypothetical protein